MENIEAYLQVTDVIDWHHPAILEKAKTLAKGQTTLEAIGQACFAWVRDEIRHSVDYHLNPVTCRASEVLQHRTGYCYAKSHLLAALLRANRIPAGFCYQRLSVDEMGPPYCLHGLNAVHIPKVGWYRIDARGNRVGVEAHYTPPQEKLAFKSQLAGEIDFPAILPEPLTLVIEALQTYSTWDTMLANLPDIAPDSATAEMLMAKDNLQSTA